MFYMSEKPKVQEIQIIYHATTRWPLSEIGLLLISLTSLVDFQLNGAEI